jgi:hypothetical protein
MAVTSLRVVFALATVLLLFGHDDAAADFVLEPAGFGPPVGASGWNMRRDPALAQLCAAEDRLAESKLTEDGTNVALAKLVDSSCKRCDPKLAPCAPSLSFDPDPAKPLGNVDLVNAWINSISEVGEVGTDMSAEDDIANATMDAVFAAVGAHTLLGIPIPDFLEGAVLPATVLAGALALSQPDFAKCRDIAEHDMGLIGLVRILYLYGPPAPGTGPAAFKITRATQDYAFKHLLTQVGGVTEWRDHPRICNIPIPVPETENHIWMTESSRYLTNQLIRAQTNPLKVDAIDKTSGYRFVNEKNGMRGKILERLQKVLADDFHEYNARPYTRLTVKSLENLHDFSDDREVRRGAKMVLHYVSAKFAASSSASRRWVPWRRLTEHENNTGLFGEYSDESTWRFMQLVGAVDVLESDKAGKVPYSESLPMLVTSTSKYRVPDLIEDLIANPDDRGAFFQRYKHEGYELYVGQPKFLISAGGVYRPGWDETFWDHVTLDVAITALVGNPILGPLLGETVVPMLINSIAEKEASSAVPTVLIPAKHGTEETELIRIDGAADRALRNNTCVALPGFACGLNPDRPDKFEPCTKHVGDHWMFIDLADANPSCETWVINDKTFAGIDDIFVVMWKSACDDSTCSEHAGGTAPTYGFFEVIEKTHDITLGKVISTTLANNGGRNFPSRSPAVYTTFDGTDIHFQMDTPVDTWGISDPAIDSMKDWRLAQGTIVNNLYPGNNDWRHACVEVDNWHLEKRLILDFHDANDPRWCEIAIKEPIKYGCAREPCPKSDLD